MRIAPAVCLLHGEKIDPLINIEETIGKTAGRRTKAGRIFEAGSTKERERGLMRMFGTPNIPRGVFRFTSHEAANVWMRKMTARLPG